MKDVESDFGGGQSNQQSGDSYDNQQGGMDQSDQQGGGYDQSNQQGGGYDQSNQQSGGDDQSNQQSSNDQQSSSGTQKSSGGFMSDVETGGKDVMVDQGMSLSLTWLLVQSLADCTCRGQQVRNQRGLASRCRRDRRRCYQLGGQQVHLEAYATCIRGSRTLTVAQVYQGPKRPLPIITVLAPHSFMSIATTLHHEAAPVVTVAELIQTYTALHLPAIDAVMAVLWVPEQTAIKPSGQDRWNGRA